MSQIILTPNRRRGPRKGTHRKKARNVSSRSDRLVILTEPGRYCPDRLIVPLMFTDITLTRGVTGSSNASNWSLRSSAYDPDPVLGTGAIPGFTELANLYGAYRVRQMKVDWEVVNRGDFNGKVLCLWPSLAFNAANSLAGNDILEYSSNPRGVSAVVDLSGGMSRARLTLVTSLLDFAGPNGFTDLTWSGTTSGNPAAMWYLNFATTIPTGFFQATGITSRVRVTYVTEFFERRSLES